MLKISNTILQFSHKLPAWSFYESFRRTLIKLLHVLCFALVPILSYSEQRPTLPNPCGGGACGSNASQFVSAGQATFSTSADGVSATINQESERAILNWQSFDIGRHNRVDFIQPNSSSTALNRIFQDVPSEILGALNANGQIYLINNNGIVFGEGAQVNVGGLIASTLDISDEIFLNQDIATALNNGLAAFEGGTELGAEIKLENGAVLTSADGGRIFLFAPKVTNEGKIQTPGGQTILGAAEDKVYLYLAGADTGIRGLLVELETGGDVENVGDIVAERGNITLIGQAVRQSGLLSANTTVQENGSIRLLARDGASIVNNNTRALATNTGDVIIEEGSRIEILPDYQSELTATDVLADQVASTIEILGKTVEFKSNTLTRAIGGQIDVTATNNPAISDVSQTPDDSRILVNAGAVIDASGDTTATVSASRHQVEAEIRANELADTPVQKNGPLQDETILIDARFGTEAADVSNALLSIERTVAERLSVGGDINFKSDGDVMLSQGATIDVSGGQVNYMSGVVRTSQLVLGDQVVDISQADKNVRYDSLADTLNTVILPDYVEGKDAGAFTISSNDAVIEGNLVARTTRGIFQQQLPSSLNNVPQYARSFEQAPLSGSFILDLSSNFFNKDVAIVNNLFANPESPLLINESLPSDHIVRINNSFINNASLGEFNINTRGKLSIENSSSIVMNTGGEFNIVASQVSVNGSIRATGGEVNFDIDSTVNPSADGSFVLSDGSVIDTSGAWVNDRADALLRRTSSNPILAIDGGKVSIEANGDLLLGNSSIIDVSGSGYLNSSEQLTAGKGGSINLVTRRLGEDTQLALNGSLLGYAFADGGELSIEANGFIVNSTGVSSDPNLFGLSSSFFSEGGFSSFNITANRHGFLIESGTNISPVMKNLVFDSLSSLPTSSISSGQNVENFTTPRVLLPHLQKPVSLAFSSQQSARQAGELDGNQNLTLGQGASINLDIGGSVTLSSDNSLFIDGSINTPAGNINLNITPPGYSSPPDLGFLSNQAIWLGSNSRLSARGAVIEVPPEDRFSLPEIRVLDAGSINLNADRGYIVGMDGSVLDVRGQRATNTYDFGLTRITETVYSDSGSIKLSSPDGILVNSTLLARAPDSRASYGSIEYELTPTSTIFVNPNELIAGGRSAPETSRVIELGNTDADLSFGFGGDVPDELHGRAIINVQRLQGSNFDNITFTTSGAVSDSRPNDRISLSDDVTLSSRQSIQFNSILFDSRDFDTISSLTPDAYSATFSSNYISLGNATFSQQNRIPTDLQSIDNSSLTFNASLIDLIGDTSITGFADFNLNSATDVRFRGVYDGQNLPNGSLNLSGDLFIRSEQIFPTTLSEYIVTTQKTDGLIEVNSTGTKPNSVLSAGSNLTIRAPNIINRGAIKAPGGTLVLDATDSILLADGSITSVSLEDETVLFGRTEAGDYVYTVEEGALSFTFNFDQLPEKRLRLASDNINIAEGAEIDISGGGSLLAYEQVPGPNGTFDILDPEQFPDHYAVVPNLDLDYAPFDFAESSGNNLSVGDQIVISSNAGGLPAGTYTLLPARYALLNGAFLIRAESVDGPITQNTTYRLADGSTLVSAKKAVANTSIIDSQYQAVSVISNGSLGGFVEVDTITASSFFMQQANDMGSSLPTLSADAGNLELIAANTLDLLGIITAGAPNGRGGLIDIQSDKIALVNSSSDTVADGFLALVASTLENAQSGSVLIGGSRTRTDEGIEFDIQSSEVVVTEGTDLGGNEIILAATDAVTVEDNAVVSTNTAKNTDSQQETLLLDGDGALLRVSSNDQVIINRNNAVNSQGNLNISGSAIINASNSITIDGTNNLTIDGALNTNNGSLGISATSISLGDTGSLTAGGLVIGSELLATADFDELVLTSQTSIDIAEGTSLDLSNLVLDTPQIRGFSVAETTVDTITANSFELRNSSGNSAELLASGIGGLVINTNRTLFGGGDVSIDGYNELNFNATQIVSYENNNTFNYSGQSLSIDTPLFTGSGRGASLIVNAVNADTLVSSNALTETIAASNSIGANLNLLVNSFILDTSIVNQSGNVLIQANGDINLLDKALIDVSGTTQDFVVETVAISAGNVDLISNSGSITASEGSMIDLSAPSIGANAGELTIEAAGSLNYMGELQASAIAGFESGGVDIKVAELSDLAGFNAKLNSAGAFNKRYIQLFGADQNIIITDGQTVESNDIRLIADQGNIIIENGGVVDASGANAGQVYLAALDEVRAEDRSLINVSADVGSNSDGGHLTIEVKSETGQINLLSGSEVNLSGDGDGLSGELRGRLRTDLVTNNLADRIDWSYTGVTGTQVLEVTSTTVNNAIDQIAVTNAINQLSSFLDANVNSLTTEIADLQLIAAPEFQGDAMTVTGTIDLVGQRYQGNPVILTLRSQGDLQVNGTITDGFNGDELISDVSSSINLIAGANINSAYRYGLNRDGGDLIFSDTSLVRTGTGDIRLASGRDILLNSARVYTAGLNAGFGTIPEQIGLFNQRSTVFPGIQLGKEGGDVYIHALRDFQADVNDQFVVDYVHRFGQSLEQSAGAINTPPTVQGINYAEFDQGIGILGGGNAYVDIGRDATNLSISIPTVIQHQGDYPVVNSIFTSYTDNSFVVLGGGDLRLNVGNNLFGGELYVERGLASIHIGGDIGSVNEDGSGLVLGVGDANVDIFAGGEVNIDAIVNPSLLPQVQSQITATPTLYTTYTDRSRVGITSITGDINYAANILNIDLQDTPIEGGNTRGVRLVPGTLEFTSLQGDIELANSITLYPSSQGGIRLLAGEDIEIKQDAGDVEIILSDTNPDLLPTADNPTNSFLDFVARTTRNPNPNIFNSPVPVHINDKENSAFVALTGDIDPKDESFRLLLAEPVDIFAGGDIVNLNANIQHNKSEDISTIQALGSILFPSERSLSDGTLQSNSAELVVNGPGKLDVIAGNNIDLGSSLGILSVGRLNNPFLPSQGADITILVGTSLDKSYNPNVTANSFITLLDEFLSGSLSAELLANDIDGVGSDGNGVSDETTQSSIASLRQRIIDRVINFAEQQEGITLTQAAAFAVFDSAPQSVKRDIYTGILFDVLATSATLASTTGPEGGLNRDSFNLGFGIIESLFPQAELQSGNLTLFNSRIQTLADGGDINIVVPGGEIDAGLPSAVEGARSQDDIGIITQGEGDINIFARGDVNINSSRIFTLGGGNILFWSSLGDVDAGRGAQDSLTPPPPVTEVVNGVVVTTFPPAIAGSGILTASTNPDIPAGSVIFGVPNGVVDAGTAGIDIGGSVVLAAQEVIGRDNFSVGGTVTGIQLADSGPPVSLTLAADSTSAGVSESVESAAVGNAQEAASQTTLGEKALNWLKVFVLGVGDDQTASTSNTSCDDTKETCKG